MIETREDLFRALVEDHGAHPRHTEAPEPAHARADGHNPMCGDRVALTLRFAADGATIDACGCRTRGCAICTASASVLAGLVAGRTRAEALAAFTAFRDACVGGGALAETPGLDADQREALEAFTVIHASPLRVKCATLPWHTLAAALTGAGESQHDLKVAPAQEAAPASASPGTPP